METVIEKKCESAVWTWSEVITTSILALLTTALFWPAVAWVSGTVATHGQLSHTLMVGGFLVMMALSRSTELRSEGIGMTGPVLKRLMISFAILAAAMFVRQSWLVFLSIGFAAAAGARAFLGRPRLADACGAVVSGLFFSASLVDRIDWPLRLIAAQWSLSWMKGLGLTPELVLRSGAGMPPALILEVDGKLYEVAAECNGFGLLSGCILSAIFLVFFWRLGWVNAVVLLPAALISALLFNSLRILGICLLAPNFPQHYHLVHEAVGVLGFWAGLSSIWFLAFLIRPNNVDGTQEASEKLRS